MSKAMADQIWASFNHSDCGTEEDNSNAVELYIDFQEGVHHIVSSSFLGRCDETSVQSPYELAAIISQKTREKFQERVLASPIKHCTDRDCVAPFKSKEIKIGKLLGSGEFSHVYEIKSFCLDNVPPKNASARDVETRKYMNGRVKYRGTKKCTYAIKHLRPNLSDAYKPCQWAQFACDLVQEAEFLAALQHPNIIKLRGVSYLGSSGLRQGPKGYFLIIDQLNETLAQRIAKWKKSTKRRSIDFFKSGAHCGATEAMLSQQLVILLQIAAALAYLHDQNIIFRDLKPQNVGFDCRRDVKLFDFGLAKMLPAGSDSYNDCFKMSIAGTPRFMAPEMLSGEAGCNLKADVYTFGLVAWESLSLQRPYAFVRHQQDLINQVVKNQIRPEINPHWPTSVIDLLEAAFGPPQQRPTMNHMFNVIRAEICHHRAEDDSMLKDSHLFRRRSAVSIDEEQQHVKRVKNAKIGELLRSSLTSSIGKLNRKISL
jgi:serine/threonine protein kinase